MLTVQLFLFLLFIFTIILLFLFFCFVLKLDLLRLDLFTDGESPFHCAALGSGQSFAVIFTFPKYDFTAPQMATLERILVSYINHVHQIFIGTIPAPGTVAGKKAAFKGSKSEHVLHSFEPVDAILKNGLWSTRHGMKFGNDLDLTNDSDEESDSDEEMM